MGLLMSLFCAAVLAGCADNAERQFNIVEANAELLHGLESLYGDYLNGDSLQVNNTFTKKIRLIEEAKWLPTLDKADLLFVVHSRQFVYHQKLKEVTKAEAAWIKLRFWLLRRFEERGSDMQSAMNEVSVFTPERIIETVDSWDRNKNNGLLPKYRFAHE